MCVMCDEQLFGKGDLVHSHGMPQAFGKHEECYSRHRGPLETIRIVSPRFFFLFLLEVHTRTEMMRFSWLLPQYCGGCFHWA